VNAAATSIEFWFGRSTRSDGDGGGVVHEGVHFCWEKKIKLFKSVLQLPCFFFFGGNPLQGRYFEKRHGCFRIGHALCMGGLWLLQASHSIISKKHSGSLWVSVHDGSVQCQVVGVRAQAEDAIADEWRDDYTCEPLAQRVLERLRKASSPQPAHTAPDLRFPQSNLQREIRR
jgi:hypothetical protein